MTYGLMNIWKWMFGNESEKEIKVQGGKLKTLR